VLSSRRHGRLPAELDGKLPDHLIEDGMAEDDWDGWKLR
jgi:enolase